MSLGLGNSLCMAGFSAFPFFCAFSFCILFVVFVFGPRAYSALPGTYSAWRHTKKLCLTVFGAAATACGIWCSLRNENWVGHEQIVVSLLDLLAVSFSFYLRWGFRFFFFYCKRGWLGIVVTCKLERVMQHFDSWKAADGFILKFDSSAAQQNAFEFWLQNSCHTMRAINLSPLKSRQHFLPRIVSHLTNDSDDDDDVVERKMR